MSAGVLGNRVGYNSVFAAQLRHLLQTISTTEFRGTRFGPRRPHRQTHSFHLLTHHSQPVNSSFPVPMTTLGFALRILRSCAEATVHIARPGDNCRAVITELPPAPHPPPIVPRCSTQGNKIKPLISVPNHPQKMPQKEKKFVSFLPSNFLL